MIEIVDKNKCCGCTACQEICPHSCISMTEDEEGFLYPVVDKEKCVDCLLCEKVCPVINRFDSKEEPLRCYLAKSRNERIRAESSSGGIFTEIAKNIIKNGGVVFGVEFDDDWQTKYGLVDSLDGLSRLRGSKYVQARIDDAYSRTLNYLKEGRVVLFTGTPCAIAGLKHYLRKEYENLLTLDIVCHSIPSPKVWRKYLNELEASNQAKVSYVSFRDKSNGWSDYSIRIDLRRDDNNVLNITESHEKNNYMRGFLKDLYTRPSCSDCPARNYASGSDITLADAWGIDRYHAGMNDEKGFSHILINSEKGFEALKGIISGIDCEEIMYEEILPNSLHAPLTRSCAPNRFRASFFRSLDSGNSMIESTSRFLEKYESRKERINRIKQISLLKFVNRLYKEIRRAVSR